MSLILIVISATHFGSLDAIRQADDQARLVAESVEQQQRVAKIIDYAALSTILEGGISTRTLSEHIDALEATHLRMNGSEGADGGLDDIYFSGVVGPALDPLVRNFAADARIVAEGGVDAAAALTRMRAVGQEIIPNVLQEVSHALHRGVSDYARTLVDIQNIAFLAAILVLLCEAVLIFLPAQLAVNSTLDRLADQAAKLERDQRAVAAKNERLEELRRLAEHDATHDPLTGLFNRRAFERESGRLATEVAERSGGFAILHIDLDRFKEINDSFGHAAGDFVLRNVADALRKSTRTSDFVARLGGDEFVILRETDGDEGELTSFAERLIVQLSRPVVFEGEICEIGASVGIAVAIAGDADAPLDPQSLVEDADIALYRAKELGRGRAVIFSESLRREVDIGRSLADAASSAVARAEFHPVYQPIFEAESGDMAGVEAFARWRSPEFGTVTPGQFLPILDRMGAAAEVDRLMLERGTADFAAWIAADVAPQTLAINMSIARLRDPALAADLRALPFDPARLCFELQARDFEEDLDDPLKYGLDVLSEAGVALTIDGFGAERVSLLNVLAARPSRIKLAPSVPRRLLRGARDLQDVAAVAAMARSAGARVAITGVETADQALAARTLGCDELQGAHFAEPTEADQLFAAAPRRAEG